MTTSAEQITQLYVGYYNRAPDPEGFAYWMSEAAEGMSLAKMADSFSKQVESRALYPFLDGEPGTTPESFLNQVYLNLLNRDADDEGLAYYSGQITEGRDIGQIIVDIISGANQPPDETVVDNKTFVGKEWVDLATERAGFEYNDFTGAFARSILDNVTADASTAAAASAQAREWFNTHFPDIEVPSVSTLDKQSLISSVSLDGSQFKLQSMDVEVASRGSYDGGTEPADLIGLNLLRGDGRFSGLDGTGYTVAVIDTGIDLNHPEFGPDSDFNGVADRIVAYRDFTEEDDGTAEDANGHGTHVASVLASGNFGVAPGVSIAALQVLDAEGNGDALDVEEALRWVIDNAEALNIVAVNMSLGSFSNVSSKTSYVAFDDEFAALAALGVVPVVAAGNAYGAFHETNTPQGATHAAADPNSIAVGAVHYGDVGTQQFGARDLVNDTAYESIDYETAADRIAAFSQRAVALETIFAPGGQIWGAWSYGGYEFKTGTSQAAPHVSGAVVLAQELADDMLGRRLSFDEVQSLLLETSVEVFDGEAQRDNVTNTNANYDRLDVYAMAEAIAALPPVAGHTPDAGDDVGNTISGATSLSVGTQRIGQIEQVGDRDLYQVQLQAGTFYTFDLSGDSALGTRLEDPVLALYSASGEYLFGQDDGGRDAGVNAFDYLYPLVNFQPSQSGTYYIAATGFGSSLGYYALNVSVEGQEFVPWSLVDEAPDWGPTDAFIPMNTVNEFALQYSGDRDTFDIELVEGRIYQIAVSAEDFDPNVSVESEQDWQYVYNEDSGPFTTDALIEFEARETGTYLVGVDAENFSHSPGAYTVAVTEIPDFSDDHAYGFFSSNIEYLYPFPGNGSVSASGRIETFGDRDWFELFVDPGNQYEINLVGVGGDPLADPYLRLYEYSFDGVADREIPIDFNDDGGDGLNSKLTYQAPDDYPIVYLEAGGFGDSWTGDYLITVDLVGQDADTDFSGWIDTTASLSPGEGLATDFDFSSDTDFIRLDVDPGVEYVYSSNLLEPWPSSFDFNIRLYDSQGSFVWLFETTENGDFVFVPYESTVYAGLDFTSYDEGPFEPVGYTFGFSELGGDGIVWG